MNAKELDNYLNANLLQLKSNYFEIFIIADFLYVTGLRPIEVLEPARWTQTDNDCFAVKLAKSNGFRHFNSFFIPNYLWSIYVAENSLKTIISVKYLDYHITKSSKYLFKKGQKNITSYVFRHNYIKQLHAKGINPTDIQKIIKHTDIKNTYNYINSNIKIR